MNMDAKNEEHFFKYITGGEKQQKQHEDQPCKINLSINIYI